MAMDCWTAAWVAHNREQKIAERLLHSDPSLEIYIPVYLRLIWVRHIRKWREIIRPLLAGYIILKLPPDITDRRLVEMASGMRCGLLRNRNGSPEYLAPGEMERLKEWETKDDASHLDFALRFHSGDLCIVRRGMLAGETLICGRTPSRGDLRGEFIRGSNRITLPLYNFSETTY